MLVDLFKALQFGNELKNPAKWKRGAINLTALGGIIDILLRIASGDQVDPELVKVLTTIIEGILILFNMYVHKASSKKV